MTHPLDPCTADELTTAVATLRAAGRLSERSFFSAGWAAEPSRADVARHEAGEAVDRRIRLIGHDREQGQSFEADVSLDAEAVASFRWVEDGQAPIAMDDVMQVIFSLIEHPDWIAALEARGITDFEKVHVEPWLAGIHPPHMPTGRVIRAIAFLHEHPEDNYYARPVEGPDGVHRHRRRRDHRRGPRGRADADGGRRVRGPIRRPTCAPTSSHSTSSQPEGPSFEVDGNVITWQRWHMRVSVNPIEGLVHPRRAISRRRPGPAGVPPDVTVRHGRPVRRRLTAALLEARLRRRRDRARTSCPTR